mmetsp:Transcript_4400/g.8477  ORF Transcript_4400/g.8477 Transcript_4400/m.8477 type:complete len:85 (-) Transcript_4400:1039-1293(-)
MCMYFKTNINYHSIQFIHSLIHKNIIHMVQNSYKKHFETACPLDNKVLPVLHSEHPHHALYQTQFSFLLSFLRSNHPLRNQEAI